MISMKAVVRGTQPFTDTKYGLAASKFWYYIGKQHPQARKLSSDTWHQIFKACKHTHPGMMHRPLNINNPCK